MKRNRPFIAGFVALAIFALQSFAENLTAISGKISGAGAKDFFLETVHPLLESKCFGCHGEDKKNIEAELDMSTREGLLKGGESGEPALVPGNPEKSKMFR